MKTFYRLKCISLSLLLLMSSWAYAQTSPVDMLQNVSNQLLSSLSKMTDRNDRALYALVKSVLLPNVDLSSMSELVVGKYWAAASPAERNQFEQEFIQFITRTYSNALSSYDNQKVRFFPIRGGISGNRAQVSSAIDQNNGQSVSVSYRVVLLDGQWKVYDFSVEGVSIVENYRSQFADALRTNGLSGLIKQLQQQNQRH
jgi:phospholipid transport system substrate-binding protein